MRKTIGAALLEENEALMREADALAEILGDVQLQNAELVARQRLADEPARRLAVQHAVSQIASLRRAVEKSATAVAAVATDTTLSDEVGELARNRERAALGVETDTSTKHMYEYVLSQPASPGACPADLAPSTAPPPTTLRTPPSRPSSARANSAGQRPPSARAKALAPQVSVSNTSADAAASEEVFASVRDALAEEKAQLLDDIAYLHLCLEDETDRTLHVERVPPPVPALQRWGDQLARAVHAEEDRAAHEERVATMLTSHAKDSARGHRGHVRRLRHIAEGTRPAMSAPPEEDDELQARLPLQRSVAAATKAAPRTPPRGAKPSGEAKVPSPPSAPRPASSKGTNGAPGLQEFRTPRAARRHRAAAAAAAELASPSPEADGIGAKVALARTRSSRLYGDAVSKRLGLEA